jgi:hypothetical protein
VATLCSGAAPRVFHFLTLLLLLHGAINTRRELNEGSVLAMQQTQSDPPRAGWLPICLALVAGYVDAYTLLAYGVYVSFMSGNTTQTGAIIGRGRLFAALDTAVAILLFVFGVLMGTWLTTSALRQSRQLLLGVIALMLGGVVGGMYGRFWLPSSCSCWRRRHFSNPIVFCYSLEAYRS